MKKKYRDLENGTYNIDPKGNGLSPFPVYCDMSAKNEAGVTEIGHDSESRMKVNGHESAGSYKKDIVYAVAMERIVAVVNQSRYCQQFIRYECIWSVFSTVGWWVSRQGKGRYTCRIISDFLIDRRTGSRAVCIFIYSCMFCHAWISFEIKGGVSRSAHLFCASCFKLVIHQK